MKRVSVLLHGMGFLLVLTLCSDCKKDFDSITLQPAPGSIPEPGGESFVAAELMSQTSTATLFNYNLQGILVTNYTRNSTASDVAFDDGVYAKTNSLGTRKNSLLVLEGFGFTIPNAARIENITVKARRFKTGSGTVREYWARLVRKRDRLPAWWEEYGVRWEDPTHSIFIPAIEAEQRYSQSGSGSNYGGYQWTPGMINDPYFGVLFSSMAPENGSVVINYDLVDITVQYSMP